MLFLFFRWAMARRQDDDEEDEAPLSPGMPVMAQRPMSNAESSKYGSSIPGPMFASNLPNSGVFDENFSIIQVIAPYQSQMVDELTAKGFPVYNPNVGNDQLALSVCAGSDAVWKFADVKEFASLCAN